MNGQADPLARTLDLDRLARLHSKVCFPGFDLELTFVVGTRLGVEVPVFHLESVNLALQASQKPGGGGSGPSACLPGGSLPAVRFDAKSNEIASEFEINLDFPAARRDGYGELDPDSDTHGPLAVATRANLRGRFLLALEPREYAYQSLECCLRVDVPKEFVEKLGVDSSFELEAVVPLIWLFAQPHKELVLQPMFVAGDGVKPPTGIDFYPLLASANEIWGKCCIGFRARCPIYVDNQDYRIMTLDDARAFRDEVGVSDAIEVLVAERFEPEDLFGGGIVLFPGTAASKVLISDNNLLPLNQNLLAHELGHVLHLGHPDHPLGLSPGCVGSVMEGSGFFVDNPEFQCESNCLKATNPLLTVLSYQSCRPLLIPPSPPVLF